MHGNSDMNAYYFDEAEERQPPTGVVLLPIVIAAIVALAATIFLGIHGPMHMP